MRAREREENAKWKANVLFQWSKEMSVSMSVIVSKVSLCPKTVLEEFPSIISDSKEGWPLSVASLSIRVRLVELKLGDCTKVFSVALVIVDKLWGW